MNTLLVFDARPLYRHSNPLEHHPDVVWSVNLFLEYVLSLVHDHRSHDSTAMQRIVSCWYQVHAGQSIHPWLIDAQGQVTDDIAPLEAILETVDVLERYYLHDVLGVLSELTNHYHVKQLCFQRLTPFTLSIIAHCVYLLHAPESNSS